MATLEEQVRRLPKAQKISLMESLWADLSHDADTFQPPAWHAGELEETERLVSEGLEHFEDWTETKRRLREA